MFRHMKYESNYYYNKSSSVSLSPHRDPQQDMATLPTTSTYRYPTPTSVPSNGGPLPSTSRTVISPYRTPLPNVFHICHESRSEVQHLYKPYGGTTFRAAGATLINVNLDTIYCPDVLFDVEDDILPKTTVGLSYYYPDRSVLFRLAMDPILANTVKSLAVPAVSLKAMGTMSENMILVLRKFKNIKELILIGAEKTEPNGPNAPLDNGPGEPRFLPIRLCPDGECQFWMHMFAGLMPVEVQTWQIRHVDSLVFKVMDHALEEGWTPPSVRFYSCRRYEDWDLHTKDP